MSDSLQLIQIFVVKYEMQHQHAHCPLAWGQAGSKEYWIRSNGCKGTAVRAGSPTKSDNWTICQYLYLILAIDIALFFQNNGWEGNQDGRKGQANGDQPGYEVWFNFLQGGGNEQEIGV